MRASSDHELRSARGRVDGITRAAFMVAVVVGLGAAYAAFTYVVRVGALGPVDQTVAGWFEHIWWAPTFPLAEAIAVAAGVECMSALVALLFLYLVWRRRWREAVALIVYPVALLIELLSRTFVDRAAPDLGHAGHLTVAGTASSLDSSFPSGHVVRGMIVLGLLAVLARRPAPVPWARQLALPLAGVLVAMIAFDRLYLGVHWLSDVVGGVLLGGCGLAATMVAMHQGVLRQRSQRR